MQLTSLLHNVVLLKVSLGILVEPFNIFQKKDGGYTQWTAFSACSAVCQGVTGTRSRQRFCTNPEPSNGGLTCLGKFRFHSRLKFEKSAI